MGTGQGAGPVEELASQIGATAVVCDHRKELLCAGQPSVAVHCRSIRKTLLGALFGRHVASGAIELDATLADLGIDDSVPPSLTSEEWSARSVTCSPAGRGSTTWPITRARRPRRAAAARSPAGDLLPQQQLTTTRSAPSSNARSARACSPSSPRPSPAHRACATSTPPASDTPPRAGHSTALTLPHLRPRPGALRPAPPRPRRVRHAQRDPGRPRPRPRLPVVGRTPRPALHRHHGPRRIIGRLRLGGQSRLVTPAIDRIIALLADQQRPGGSGRAVHRPALAKLVHYATDGAVPLSAVLLASDRARRMTGTVHDATAGVCTDYGHQRPIRPSPAGDPGHAPADPVRAPGRDAHLMAVNIWVALHGITSPRTSRPPDHPCPPVQALIDAALAGPSRARPPNITTR